MFIYAPHGHAVHHNGIAPTSPAYLLPSSRRVATQKEGLSEGSLIEWAKTLCSPDREFIDVGAHTGTYTVTLAPLCSFVWAFEPQEFTFYGLCGAVALNYLRNVACYHMAVGSEEQEGREELRIISEDGGGSSIVKLPRNAHARTETVDVCTLDSFEFERVGLIKIDVEGNEANALKGAVATLERCKPRVLFEANPAPEFLDGNAEAERVLRGLGYQIHAVNCYPNMRLAARP